MPDEKISMFPPITTLASTFVVLGTADRNLNSAPPATPGADTEEQGGTSDGD
jgi:hypothetical protein